MHPLHVQTHALYFSTQMKGVSNEQSSMHVDLNSMKGSFQLPILDIKTSFCTSLRSCLPGAGRPLHSQRGCRATCRRRPRRLHAKD
ncbi:hypothetical protein BAE44_0026120 [Dichanthelium oligosanthes]|uniref:Uncharacterized protein n=1 Tax=Dichanthelium oligosanthes TaxID=888268 RepID=A0A1E5UJ15_9POAL|nr:hypothetical protein BAE44_0026120 [Dichanthelium oligosanthes]